MNKDLYSNNPPAFLVSYHSKVLFFFGQGVHAGFLNDIDKDKYMHFSAGVVISHAAYPLYKRVLRKRPAWFYAFGTAVAVSVIKEACDSGDTGFDVEDLAYGALGGLTIIVVKF